MNSIFIKIYKKRNSYLMPETAPSSTERAPTPVPATSNWSPNDNRSWPSCHYEPWRGRRLCHLHHDTRATTHHDTRHWHTTTHHDTRHWHTATHHDTRPTAHHKARTRKPDPNLWRARHDVGHATHHEHAWRLRLALNENCTLRNYPGHFSS